MHLGCAHFVCMNISSALLWLGCNKSMNYTLGKKNLRGVGASVMLLPGDIFVATYG